MSKTIKRILDLQYKSIKSPEEKSELIALRKSLSADEKELLLKEQLKRGEALEKEAKLDEMRQRAKEMNKAKQQAKIAKQQAARTPEQIAEDERKLKEEIARIMKESTVKPYEVERSISPPVKRKTKSSITGSNTFLLETETTGSKRGKTLQLNTDAIMRKGMSKSDRHAIIISVLKELMRYE